MTVGFTGAGSEGDYFTLDHRVRTVRVSRVGVDGDLGTHVLDPDARGLQDIAIDGPGGDFRIEIVPARSSRDAATTWRELCVSELEVWGTPPPGAPTQRQDPDVVVGSLEAAPPPPPPPELAASEPLPDYASVAEFCAAFRARPILTSTCMAIDTDCDARSQATCGEPADGQHIAHLPAGWSSLTYFLAMPARHRTPHCNAAIGAAGRVFVVEDLADSACGAAVEVALGATRRTRQSIEVVNDVVEIVATTSDPTTLMPTSTIIHETLRLCGARSPACTPAIELGRIERTEQSGGGLGSDGLSIEYAGWQLDWKLVGKRLELSPRTGTLDADARAELGAHQLQL